MRGVASDRRTVPSPACGSRWSSRGRSPRTCHEALRDGYLYRLLAAPPEESR
ncbi:hypothetical protein [Streptomyces cavernae]|uniref:hypothetical protein n=1 Tax=Streptomyces cavernae TaxID=2259034 RepID=UPI0012D925F1|nr:hypothetical protein [Streptomyces cavernae]